jgi:hypothetical protein
MNRIIISTAGILLIFPCLTFAGKKELKNKVRSCTTMSTVYENGKAASWKESYEEFDRAGNTTLYVLYNKEGSVQRKEVKSWDKNGNITEETVTDAKESKSCRITYTYTVVKDKSLLAEESEFSPSGSLVKKTAYTYNASKKKASETITDGTGQIVKKIMYNYNSKNLKTHKQVYGKNNMPESSKEYQYVYY